MILIGRDAGLIESALSGVVKTERATSLPEAVNMAHQHARVQEKVILSPACASFDMFNGFADRGNVFIHEVEALT